MTITLDDLKSAEIARFLEEHIEEMKSVSPPESKHALDLDGLRKPDISFWTVHHEGKILGCGALKQLTNEHGEIKSMRVATQKRGAGIGSTLLRHIIKEAINRHYHRLSLETGAMPFFNPARSLYRKHGFVECGPFASYKEDPNSVFMTRQLPAATPAPETSAT